jgi:site-specific recombinase XerD
MANPTIKNLKKGLINMFTNKPRSPTPAMPVQQISAAIIRHMPNNARLSMERLRNKTMALLTIVLMLRPSELALISRGDIRINPDKSQMVIEELGFKSDKGKDGTNRIVYAASNPKTCPVRAMAALLQHQAANGATNSDPVFVSMHSGQSLSAQRCATILGEVTEMAGLDRHVLTAKTWRTGSSTHAIQQGIAIHQVRKIGGWRDTATLLRHYDQSTQEKGCTDTLLGLTHQ